MRGKFFIFAAGYPDNMETFLKVNPGLSSRFDKMLKFEDYQPAELSQIAEKMIQDEGLKITSKALDHLSKYFNYNFLGEPVHQLKEKQRAINNLITYDDVKEFTLDKKGFVFNKKTIGFRRKSKS